MRDRGMAKLFSFSCISAGTAALPAADGQKQPKSSPGLADAPPPPPQPQPLPASRGEGEGGEPESTKKGHNNMIRRFMKSFSHLFSLSHEEGEEDDDDDYDEEREMVIGFPTDVKHLTHIGWDGLASATATAGIANADAKTKSTKGPELLSLDSLSLKHFEAAMATLQAAAAGDPPPPPLRHRGLSGAEV